MTTTHLSGRRRRPDRQTMVLVAIIIVLSVISAALAVNSQRDARLAQDNASSIASQVRAACDRNGVTARELGDLCRQAEQVEERPAETIPGPPPTVEEVRAAVVAVLTEQPGLITPFIPGAVAEYLQRNPPQRGLRGADGEDAPPPSASQVDAAVAAICAGDACRGRDGIDGIDGDDGEDGSDGTAGSDGQGGADGADGIDGEDGADGADGEDGRGIVSIEFVNGGDCRMVIRYTDDTIDEFELNPSMCLNLP